MSYILEALKKSSEARGRLSPEAKLEPVFVSASDEGPGGLLSWRLIAIASLIGLVAMAAFWVGTNLRSPVLEKLPAPELARTEPVQSARSPAQVSRPDRNKESARRDSPESGPHTAALAEKAPVSAKPAGAAPANVPPEPPRQSPEKPSEPVRNDAPAVAAHASSTAPGVGTDMPPDLLKQVQGISIAAHVFSRNPPDRMVIINGQALHEGDTLPSGIAVEQITSTGVVLAFKGYRVNKPVVQ